MIINAWLEIRDDFAFPSADPASDTELQAKNRETLALCGDLAVIPGLYKGRTQGPRSWKLYSLLYDVASRQEFEQAVELFKSENAGKTDVLGAWDFNTGEQVKDNNVPLYPIPGRLASFMPDDIDQDGNPVPNATLRDINLYYGQAARVF